MGIEFRTTNDRNEFENYAGEKVIYSNERIADAFFIKPSGLLQENVINKHHIKVGEKENVKVLFPTDDDDLGFDIFTAVFYMVSRYEEYLPYDADEFGRFKAKDSIAFKIIFYKNKTAINSLNLTIASYTIL